MSHCERGTTSRSTETATPLGRRLSSRTASATDDSSGTVVGTPLSTTIMRGLREDLAPREGREKNAVSIVPERRDESRVVRHLHERLMVWSGRAESDRCLLERKLVHARKHLARGIKELVDATGEDDRAHALLLAGRADDEGTVVPGNQVARLGTDDRANRASGDADSFDRRQAERHPSNRPDGREAQLVGPFNRGECTGGEDASLDHEVSLMLQRHHHGAAAALHADTSILNDPRAQLLHGRDERLGKSAIVDSMVTGQQPPGPDRRAEGRLETTQRRVVERLDRGPRRLDQCSGPSEIPGVAAGATDQYGATLAVADLESARHLHASGEVGPQRRGSHQVREQPLFAGNNFGCGRQHPAGSPGRGPTGVGIHDHAIHAGARELEAGGEADHARADDCRDGRPRCVHGASLRPTGACEPVDYRCSTGQRRPSGRSHLTMTSPTPLYDPRRDHDACGVGMVADLQGRRTHEVIDQALTVVEHLEHRGATGAEPDSGDGAGILLQVPDEFLREEFAAHGVALPEAGSYAAGCCMVPKESGLIEAALALFGRLAKEEGLGLLGWRPVPTDNSRLGHTSRSTEPDFIQIVLGAVTEQADPLDVDRRAYVVRRRFELELPDVYVCSLSARTIVYKGMLTAPQLRTYFTDLSDPRMRTTHAIVHSRFATNTLPRWPLAHPYRYIAHNGEINTVIGNRNWMRAREATIATPLIEGDLERILPICVPGGSDSAALDEVLELLHLGGRSLPHAVMMTIPAAWEHNTEMPPEHRAFYRFHAGLMEPWDGPASVTFSDGRLVGAVLDRNGLRPARWWVTADGLVIFSSEVGVLPIDPADVVQKGRLAPGRMFLVDTVEGRIVDDRELKDELAGAAPYEAWLDANLVHFADLPERRMLTPRHDSVVTQQRLHGYTEEEVADVITPAVLRGDEPVGSMGSDTPVAVLSRQARPLFDYFTQLFAQVTNPPLDAIREELVTSMADAIGPEGNLLHAGPESCQLVVLESPVLATEELAKLRYINEHGETPGFSAYAIDGWFDATGTPTPAEAGSRLEVALRGCFNRIDAAIAQGANIIILSDRNSGPTQAPIPSLLLTAAVHHHLTRTRQRTKATLLVECADARTVHHLALLVAYGASAVNPYLALDTIADLADRGLLGAYAPDEAQRRWRKAMTKGIRKVMSKMGVSTVASYRGAQLFEAIGVSSNVIDQHFTGTASRIGGIGLEQLAADSLERHAAAYAERPSELAHRPLPIGGDFQWRREGELHLFNPTTVYLLQHSARSRRRDVFDRYTTLVDEQSDNLLTLRGLLRLRGDQAPVALDEVEPVQSIFRRFATGAMSYGSISKEAHETIAIAMNRLGGKSNTGEGGEDADRFVPDPNGDQRRSAIKQIASGRFGVTSEYLADADEIQIKIAQGAKPGEGGQLPGAKVHVWIARTRHATPGVELISPPPHHDIYSIEDLAH